MPTKTFPPYNLRDENTGASISSLGGIESPSNFHSRSTSMVQAQSLKSQHRQTFQHQNGSTLDLFAQAASMKDQAYGGGGPERLVRPSGLADHTVDGNAPFVPKHLPMYSINEENSSDKAMNGNNYYPSYHETNHEYAEEKAFPVYNVSRRKSELLPVPLDSRQRTRSLSVSIQEASKQLAPPVSLPLVFLCLSWYACSALSNTLNKSILNQFPYPVSLSMIQFVLAFLSGITTILVSQKFSKFNHVLPPGTLPSNGLLFPPTKEIILMTAPMGCFQLSGHILSHMATRIIPVSLVHTIKALSPLFTVMAYRLIFRVKYKSNTYLTLIPLTVGVMLTCSTEFSAQYVGIFYALIATLIFVSQNMFSKKLLTHSSHNDNISIANSNSKGNGGNSGAKKFDKLTILIYCSALAFIFTFPIWFFSEGLTIIKQVYYYQTSSPFYTGVVASTIKASQIGYSIRSLFTQFLLNGVIHFLQNILSFQVLGMVSPVTYSVASLVKRIVVIVVAIIWFGQKVNWVQGWGIALTFTGLYLYDRFGVDKKSNKVELVKTRVLPK